MPKLLLTFEPGPGTMMGPEIIDWCVAQVSSLKEAVAETLAPFWSGSAVTVDEVLDELVRRGWSTEREPYGLTPAGEAPHAALAQIVERAGHQLRDGVSTQRYADTVDVLRHLVANEEDLRRSAS